MFGNGVERKGFAIDLADAEWCEGGGITSYVQVIKGVKEHVEFTGGGGHKWQQGHKAYACRRALHETLVVCYLLFEAAGQVCVGVF